MARVGKTGAAVKSGIVWQIRALSPQKTYVDMQETPAPALRLPPGDYKAEVMRLKDEAYAQKIVTLKAGQPQTFTLLLPELKPDATLEAPASAVAGATITIGWTGPDASLDFISTAAPGARAERTITYSYTSAGAPLKIQMPPLPGVYELRYVSNATNKVLARKNITVTPFPVSIDLPETAIAGETLALNWVGPNYDLDYLSTANPTDRGSATITYSYTRGGTPLGLKMPSRPGTYEVRYVLNEGKTIVFRKTIRVTEVSATIMAPDVAVAGETLPIEWTGPDYDLDYLAIAKPATKGNASANYSYTKDGKPLGLLMPTTPGTYEIRYVMNQDRRIIARKPIKIVKVRATLDSADTATAGETLMVNWSGPNYKLDVLTVAKIGSRGDKSINYSYTRDGSPLGVKMPITPGTYELRYVAYQGATVLAKKTITVK